MRKDWEGRTAGAATACARAEKALTALRWETRFALSFAPATEVLAQRACWEMAAIVFVGVDGKGDVRRKCAEERGGPSIWLCQLGGHTNIDGREDKEKNSNFSTYRQSIFSVNSRCTQKHKMSFRVSTDRTRTRHTPCRALRPSSPDASMSDPHADLGLRPDASDAEIKAAFRRLALVHHPDKHDTPETIASAKHRFNKITAARNRLLGFGGGVGGGAHGTNHGGAAWAHHAGASGIRNANKVSNLGFAVVLLFPVCLMSVVSQWAFPSDGLGRGADETGQTAGNAMGRIHGVLQPPVNKWLRDDVLAFSENKASSRPALATRLRKRVSAALVACGAATK